MWYSANHVVWYLFTSLSEHCIVSIFSVILKQLLNVICIFQSVNLKALLP
jgi:hypothetical protein